MEVLCVHFGTAPGNWSLTNSVWMCVCVYKRVFMIYPFEHTSICRICLNVCMNVHMCVGDWQVYTGEVCMFVGYLWTHTCTLSMPMSVCVHRRACVTLDPCGSICVWVLTDDLSGGINMACLPFLGCLAGVYSLVRTRFVKSHITLILMFAAQEGNVSEIRSRRAVMALDVV